ncbi:MAG TPA: TRAP transporter small permease [Syntrophorhabdaceae bacterium]|nr:TRAP transporter small permease [Syntrophorhabdaceae bacterium]HQM81605.1 TRAP transporter small permease [Syntrophorhabdaceae bacterium]
MNTFLRTIDKVCRFLSAIAGTVLVFMMLLTVADVIMRAGNRPIMGTYEIVSFSGAVVMGLVNPLTSWMRNHIFADFLIDRFPRKTNKAFRICTRCLAIFLFVMIGWNLMTFGGHLKEASEVSFTLAIPFYPIAYGIGISALIQCFVFVADIFRIIGENHE